MMVPVEWVIGLAGVLAAGFCWVLVYFVRRNDDDHATLFTTLRRLERRLIHLIAHHKPEIPRFEDDDEDSEMDKLGSYRRNNSRRK